MKDDYSVTVEYVKSEYDTGPRLTEVWEEWKVQDGMAIRYLGNGTAVAVPLHRIFRMTWED